MAQYWYDEQTSIKRVKDLKTKYDELVKACIGLRKTMQEYVCQDGKWYDDNAVMVSKWWNQSNDGKTSGKLVWNEKKSELQFSNESDGKFDGEDRIRGIMGGAAELFINGVCYSLSCLSDSHKSVKENFKKEIAISDKLNGTDHSQAYTTDLASTKKKMDIMESLGCKNYKSTPLPTGNSDARKSDTKEMNDFIKKVKSKLNNINEKFEDFAKALTATCTNPSKDKWWGFDVDTLSSLTYDISETNKFVEKRLQNFQNNINIALEHTTQAKDLNLKKLKTKFK